MLDSEGLIIPLMDEAVKPTSFATLHSASIAGRRGSGQTRMSEAVEHFLRSSSVCFGIVGRLYWVFWAGLPQLSHFGQHAAFERLCNSAEGEQRGRYSSNKICRSRSSIVRMVTTPFQPLLEIISNALCHTRCIQQAHRSHNRI